MIYTVIMIKNDYPLYFISYFMDGRKGQKDPDLFEVTANEIKVYKGVRRAGTSTVMFSKSNEPDAFCKRNDAAKLKDFFKRIDLDGDPLTRETAGLEQVGPDPLPFLTFQVDMDYGNKIIKNCATAGMCDLNLDGQADSILPAFDEETHLPGFKVCLESSFSRYYKIDLLSNALKDAVQLPLS